MTLTLKSVTRDATDDPSEVLVAFQRDNGSLRNVLLRGGSDFAVPESAITETKTALDKIDAARGALVEPTEPPAPATPGDDTTEEQQATAKSAASQYDADFSAYRTAKTRYLADVADLEEERAKVIGAFEAIAEANARKQAEKEDTPPAEVDEAAEAAQ